MSVKTPPPVPPANQDPQQIEAAQAGGGTGSRVITRSISSPSRLLYPRAFDRVIVTSYYPRGDLDPSGEGQGGQPAHDELGIQATNIHGRPLYYSYGVVSGFSMRAEHLQNPRFASCVFHISQLSC